MAKVLLHRIALLMDTIVRIFAVWCHVKMGDVTIYFHTIWYFAELACGGRFYAPNGEITSPGYPDSYRSSMDCIYTIKVASGKKIHLDVKSFELESSSTCDFDSLEIRFERIFFLWSVVEWCPLCKCLYFSNISHRNGPTDKSPLLGKFCGTDIPPRIDSISNQLYMRFKTDYSDERKGKKWIW